MEYEGQICRSPMERGSFMLPVAVGCSYNRCRFCALFKHLTYRELPIEQVEQELKRVSDVGGQPKQIFLGDGNAFCLPTDHLLRILDLIHQYFPSCEAVNMDATVTSIRLKSDAELKALSDAGVRHLYLGIESGLDDVLAFMEKDHTLAQAYEAIKRLSSTRMIYDAHMMTGVAGKDRGMENAEAIAEFFNRTKPSRITNFSMFLHAEAPLGEDIRAGRFTPATELENLQEEWYLLSLLQVPDLVYEGFHDFLEVRIRGILPQDRGKMLRKLDQEIQIYSEREPIVAYIEKGFVGDFEKNKQEA